VNLFPRNLKTDAQVIARLRLGAGITFQKKYKGEMMNKLDALIDFFELSEQQRAPVLLNDKNVIVTAGAGSGKTRTLVARYAALLYQYQDPRKVVAITFSDKAALEMSSRVRDAIVSLIKNAENEQDRALWISMNQKVDSARISTIHSLCAEILRNHPSEAAIDPRAVVLDEAEIAALFSEVIRDTLQSLANDPKFEPVFENIKIRNIEKILKFFLSNRLRIDDFLGAVPDYHIRVEEFFQIFMTDPELRPLIDLLASLSDKELIDDNRYEMVKALLGQFSQIESYIDQGNFPEAMKALHIARNEYMKLNKGRKNVPSYNTLEEIRTRYDAVFGSVIDGQEVLIDPVYELVRRLVTEMFGIVKQNYERALRDRQKLDFDSLEFYARELLQIPHVRAHWQNEISALLVDEFQDTNTRQRDLVEALTEDRPGKLFMVGDARQSIYRFRQADVSVFRSVLEETSQVGYRKDLSVSYRTTEPLLNATGQLLASVMGTVQDQSRPYSIPYTPLEANRKSIEPHIKPPHIEVHLAKGYKDDLPRKAMGRMLAQRLIELRMEEQIKDWGDVAILCRAAKSYAFYEDAFEEFGIPYVTVAGRGFYERPEVRDVINILRALADPTDDQAMAGLLRSPAFGLSDAALYLLRQSNSSSPRKFFSALRMDHPSISVIDQTQLSNTRQVIDQLLPLVDRVPVYELMKTVINTTHYRTILAMAEGGNASGREWRNIDKLINDCQAAHHLVLKDYLEFIDTIAEEGVRTGEAPSEALGAITIMTIHKSKGLEYPVIVLGDASRDPSPQGPVAFIDPRSGIVFRTETNSVHYKIALQLEKDQEREERNRLLYVALTRAKDKLILSGHQMLGRSSSIKGWMGDVNEVLKFDEEKSPIDKIVGDSHYRILISDKMPDAPSHPATAPSVFAEPKSLSALPLYQPISPGVEPDAVDETAPVAPPLRTTGYFFDESPRVEGSIIHKAIELGLDPSQPSFASFVETFMLSEGVVDSTQKERIARRVNTLLTRYLRHPIQHKVTAAQDRYHEIPYTYMAGGRLQNGIIDLVYRNGEEWVVLDFKTNHINTAEKKTTLLARYTEQLDRYSDVLHQQMGIRVKKVLCFLDDHENVTLTEVQ
jgi:ATP-dependent helicase/nuclease subunit A